MKISYFFCSHGEVRVRRQLCVHETEQKQVENLRQELVASSWWLVAITAITIAIS